MIVTDARAAFAAPERFPEADEVIKGWPQDVLPNRTVLSEDVTELHVDKDERGHVRDGYRRGWLYKLIDKYGFF